MNKKYISFEYNNYEPEQVYARMLEDLIDVIKHLDSKSRKNLIDDTIRKLNILRGD